MSVFEYKIIHSSQESIYTVKKSKFIAYAFRVSNTSAVESSLGEVKKTHNKAGHHCYGYRLGLDKNNFRANDDGEPSGTAGRPILGQIDSKELTNTLVVVVRYFGGIKLGASGLISAYKTAARQVLDECLILEKQVTKTVRIASDHQHIGILMTNAKKLGFEIGEISYDPQPLVHLLAPLKNLAHALDVLKARTIGISIEEAKTLEANDVFHIFGESSNDR